MTDNLNTRSVFCEVWDHLARCKIETVQLGIADDNSITITVRPDIVPAPLTLAWVDLDNGEPKAYDLTAIIETLSDMLVTEHGDQLQWWKGDGSYCDLIWDVEPRTISLAVNLAYVEYETYSYELDAHGQLKDE